MKKNVKKKLLISFTSLSFFTPLIVSAQLNEYVNNLYLTAIGLSGLLAVIMIVAGAAYLTISGASPDKQKEGKSYITAALLGLMLLLGAFVLLNTINPELVELQNPYDPNFDLPDGQQSGGAGTGVGPQALNAGSSNAQRADHFCQPSMITACAAMNDPGSYFREVANPNLPIPQEQQYFAGDSIDVINCINRSNIGVQQYTCENNIQTQEYTIPNNKIGDTIRWQFYYTLKDPSYDHNAASVGIPTGYAIQPRGMCLISHIGNEEVAASKDFIGSCSMP